MKSDSAATIEQKERIEWQLATYGIPLKKWFIEGATLQDLQLILRITEQATQRFNDQESPMELPSTSQAS